MNMVTTEQIEFFINDNVNGLHATLPAVLDDVSLHELLQRENPYQLIRRGPPCAHDLIRVLLDKHLDRYESHWFGQLMEQLAVYVCRAAYGGWKSELRGIDLEFAKDSYRYVVSFTPYPDYDEGNESLTLEDDFRGAAISIKRPNPSVDIIAVNGCFYGWHPVTDEGEYVKCCGPAFWELISGDAELYKRIVEPLRKASVGNSTRKSEMYGRTVNRLSAEFYRLMCNRHGKIDWETVAEFASSRGCRQSKSVLIS